MGVLWSEWYRSRVVVVARGLVGETKRDDQREGDVLSLEREDVCTTNVVSGSSAVLLQDDLRDDGNKWDVETGFP